MTMRVAVLGRMVEHLQGSLAIQDGHETALRDLLPNAKIVALSGSLGLMPAVLRDLAAVRPHIVIAEGFGPAAQSAAVYRALSPGSRLLLCATRPPGRFGLLDRLILGFADGVLAEDDDVIRAVERLRFRPGRFYPMQLPADLDLFMACAPHRYGAAAHRLLYAGALTPEAGAADVLIALAAWAERNPDRTGQIWWAGDGDLTGILEAQPLPANLTQVFLGNPERHRLPAIFDECGIIITPSPANDRQPSILEALAGSLVTLSSRRLCQARHVTKAGGLGWTFDPQRHDDLAFALSSALNSSPDDLNAMREAGRMLARGANAGGLVGRMRDAIFAVLPDSRHAADTAVPSRHVSWGGKGRPA